MRAFWLLGVALWPLGTLWAQSESQRFAPLAYFEDNCARCHGPNGSFYGAEFGKGLKDDAALKQVVREMCEGPGNAPLDDAKLEILTEFHRALRDDKPFLCVVWQGEAELKGEASPDATVSLENGAKSIAAERKGNQWSVKWPADFELKGAKVVACRGEKRVQVELNR